MLDGALGFVRGAVVGGDLVFVVKLEASIPDAVVTCGSLPCNQPILRHKTKKSSMVGKRQK